MATAEFRGLTDVRQYWWLYLSLVAALTIWCLVDVMPRGSINRQRINEHRTDFTVYTEAGAAFFDGRDPYQVSNRSTTYTATFDGSPVRRKPPIRARTRRRQAVARRKKAAMLPVE